MPTEKTPVTSANALFTFYDIESLSNVFTLCTFNPRSNEVEVFYRIASDDGVLDRSLNKAAGGQVDVRRIWETVTQANPAWEDREGVGRPIRVYDLATYADNVHLAQVFGLSDAKSVNNPRDTSSYDDHLRPVCDTDPAYDPINKHPYLVGYNSNNYDTSILALYLMEAFATVNKAIRQHRQMSDDQLFRPVDPAVIRGYNDGLFQDEYRSYMPSYLVKGPPAGGKGWNSVPHRIRTAMLHSGRHIDAANFNESQKRVALKRLLGGQGRQILESDKLGIHNSYVETVEDFYDLLAYNVSDVVGLSLLFEDSTYASGFDLKKGLLDEFPETVYDRDNGAYRPGIRPDNVRRNRLTPDSTSAKFVTMILSPYGNLKDLETVSFMYPSERVAAELDIEPVNVLEESRKFFYESIEDPEAREQFDKIYEYYRSIEGMNFNESEEYTQDHPQGPLAHTTLTQVPKVPNNLPYFTADGSPTTCFATFSTGGIHGAEADWREYGVDLAAWRERRDLMLAVKEQYPDPLVVRSQKLTTVLVPGPDGPVEHQFQYKELLTSKTRLKSLKERSERVAALGPNPDPADVEAIDADYPGEGYKPLPKRPQLFEPSADGSNKLKPKYTFTSAEKAIHEDFTSYYPNMLRNMSAFYNPELGEDRYAKIFFDKERYGKMMKDPSLPASERERLGVLRNGTKLILNTASGAGDTTHHTSIRMNNRIISMRIIG